MYEIKFNIPNGSKGRMQKAVDEWEKNAKDNLEADGTGIPKASDNAAPENAVAEKDAAENPMSDISGNDNQAVDTPAAPLSTDAEDTGDDETAAEIKSKFKKIASNKSQENINPTPDDKEEKKPEKKSAEVFPEEPLDYESEEQAQEIIADQSDMIFSLTVRFILCLFFSGLLVWLACAPVFDLPLPFYLSLTDNALYYIGANAVLLLIIGFLSFSVSFRGILSLFMLRPDADSIVSLAFYSTMACNIYLLFNPQPVAQKSLLLYTSGAALGIAFNLLGKIFIMKRVRGNLKFISNPKNSSDGFGVVNRVNVNTANIIIGSGSHMPVITRHSRARFLTNYLEKSYTPTPSDRFSRTFCLIALAAAIGTGGCVWAFLGGDIAKSVTAFTAVCCAAVPLILEISVSVPFMRTCKKLIKKQVLVTGCEAVSVFGSADAMIANSSLIFPLDCARVYGVKTFSGHDIEEAVLYAASIACAGENPFAEAFMSMFSDDTSGQKLLKHCEKLVFEDEKGLSAVIDDRVILLGSREILRHHLIEAPSHDYEVKYTASGRNLIYLAIGGELCAMFVVGYGTAPQTAFSLTRLRRFGMPLLIESSDPNITPNLIEEKCGISCSNVSVLTGSEMQQLGKPYAGGRQAAGVAFKDFAGYVTAVISCIKLKGTFNACMFIQSAASLFGMLLAVYIIFLGGGIGMLTPVHILAYQLVWALPVLIISLFRRN